MKSDPLKLGVLFLEFNGFVDLASELRVFNPPARKLYWEKEDVLQSVHVDGSFYH